MAVKPVVKINGAKLKQLSQAAIKALEMTGEALHTEVVQAQVVPRDKGPLQGEKFSVNCDRSSSGKVSLIHEGPYARRLYYHPEYNFQTKENPNARGKWFEPWQKGGENEKFVPETFKKFYKRFSGL